MKIQKSQIRQEYLNALATGMDDWDARASVISSVMSSDPETEYYVSELGTDEYYFTIQNIWNLCDE
jgi:hypothetical protein